jgi:cyanobactin maturation PatA/PatG family protease
MSERSVPDPFPALWSATLGDERICIAILDGPVDGHHIAFKDARLAKVERGASAPGFIPGLACEHGTYVASLIFGQHESPVKGVAPRCAGLLIPIFGDSHDGRLLSCSQVALAHAIKTALERGANIINISGGEFTPSGVAHPLLADVLDQCDRQGVLVVAAAGNDGCECLHIPAAHPSILAVGAANAIGEPLASSNWGAQYQGHGILAFGENLRGAAPGGKTVRRSGTSAATAIVSGVAGLLMSVAAGRGLFPSGSQIRQVLLQSSDPCPFLHPSSCLRYLSGVLNTERALSLISSKEFQMSLNEPTKPQPLSIDAEVERPSEFDGRSYSQSLAPSGQIAFDSCHATQGASWSSSPGTEISPSACSCGGGSRSSPQLVFAFGKIGYEFGSQARFDSIWQHMFDRTTNTPRDPYNVNQFLAYLDEKEYNASDATSVIWTLEIESVPVYAIAIGGPNAGLVIKFLKESLKEQQSDTIDRVSVAGMIGGRLRLSSGEELPLIYPELRGTSSWKTAGLMEEAKRLFDDNGRLLNEAKRVLGDEAKRLDDEVKSLQGKRSADAQRKLAQTKEQLAATNQKVTEAGQKVTARPKWKPIEDALLQFLNRVYYARRNLGLAPRDRAINYLATNVYLLEQALEEAWPQDVIKLDSIDAEPSPVCRAGSDCWDVKLAYFFPSDNSGTARQIYRVTVDVSDVVPVTIGKFRHWPSAD